MSGVCDDISGFWARKVSDNLHYFLYEVSAVDGPAVTAVAFRGSEGWRWGRRSRRTGKPSRQIKPISEMNPGKLPSGLKILIKKYKKYSQ
jgi:hypothetical protein